MWSKPKRSAPVEWWYLGSDNYYHYMAERWGMSRKAWKIQIAELQFTGVDLHYPEVGDDTKVGVILGEGHLPFNHKYNK